MRTSSLPTPIPGERFGRRVVLSDDGYDGKYLMVLVECDCGKTARVRWVNLARGKANSCFGCPKMRSRWGEPREKVEPAGPPRTMKRWPDGSYTMSVAVWAELVRDGKLAELLERE